MMHICLLFYWWFDNNEEPDFFFFSFPIEKIGMKYRILCLSCVLSLFQIIFFILEDLKEQNISKNPEIRNYLRAMCITPTCRQHLAFSQSKWKKLSQSPLIEVPLTPVVVGLLQGSPAMFPWVPLKVLWPDGDDLILVVENASCA